MKGYDSQFRLSIIEQIKGTFYNLSETDAKDKLLSEKFQNTLLTIFQETHGTPAVMVEDPAGLWLVPQDPSLRRVLILSADKTVAFSGLVLFTEKAFNVSRNLFE